MVPLSWCMPFSKSSRWASCSSETSSLAFLAKLFSSNSCSSSLSSIFGSLRMSLERKCSVSDGPLKRTKTEMKSSSLKVESMSNTSVLSIPNFSGWSRSSMWLSLLLSFSLDYWASILTTEWGLKMYFFFLFRFFFLLLYCLEEPAICSFSGELPEESAPKE